MPPRKKLFRLLAANGTAAGGLATEQTEEAARWSGEGGSAARLVLDADGRKNRATRAIRASEGAGGKIVMVPFQVA
jgi:hypothetical protein